MRAAVVIPSLGASSLPSCLEAVAEQTAPPVRVVVVHSGSQPRPDCGQRIEVLAVANRLGFAAACNRGIDAVLADVDAVALLNDDAKPCREWLAQLIRALENHTDVGAVQGTVTTSSGTAVDGRGLWFDRYGLPRQVDRGRPSEEVQQTPTQRAGVSATAALFRCTSLKAAALPNGQFFDEAFDCYHEDVDLALRLWRVRQLAYWVPGALCRHLGSETGSCLSWRHSWWILNNRWRALAGNLTLLAMARNLPSFIRGEVRAVRTLGRHNPRTWIVAVLVAVALPLLILRGRKRSTPGPRLGALPRLKP